jgi:hypothetical protein
MVLEGFVSRSMADESAEWRIVSSGSFFDWSIAKNE